MSAHLNIVQSIFVSSPHFHHIFAENKYSTVQSGIDTRHAFMTNLANKTEREMHGYDASSDTELEDSVTASVVDKEAYLNNLALFYLRMQAKMLLPATTIQTIIEEFQEVNNNGITHVLSKVHEQLTMLNIEDSVKRKVIDDLSKENLMKICNDVFRSDKTRKNFFLNNFNYVVPTKVYLGADATGRERFLQYISIKDTLKSLMSQSSMREQYDAHICKSRYTRRCEGWYKFQRKLTSTEFALLLIYHFVSGFI